MGTEVAIEGADFLISGRPTYEGRVHEGRRIEGLLLNSRMVQAIFDDECEETRGRWSYPDTGLWDPERNTDEFIAMLPAYRAQGLRAVTVGLQGGGSVYTRPLSDIYLNSAFRPDGSLKPAYLSRLHRVIEAADAAGIVVIVNYFYWRQERFADDAAVERATEAATAWLLATGFRNLVVDVKNEVREGEGLLFSRGIHRLLDIVGQTRLNGRRLLLGTSTHPNSHIPSGRWAELADLFMPHGNNQTAERWRPEMRALKAEVVATGRIRPICCNEDSITVENLDVSIDEGCSWGYYDQGYGCDEKQTKIDWTLRPRETEYEALSGFQTIPVNWSINTPHKRAFFDRLREITAGG
jgi:hypothetical protein